MVHGKISLFTNRETSVVRLLGSVRDKGMYLCGFRLDDNVISLQKRW